MKKIMLFFPVLFWGCLAPLPPVTYNQPASVTSTKIAKIELVTGEVGGDATSYSYNTYNVQGNYLVSTTQTGSVVPTNLHFGIGDQKTFLKSLSNELLRLNIVSDVLESTSTKKGDLSIKLVFEKTYHKPNIQEYLLDVRLDIETEKGSITHNYHIVSSEGDSWWKKINTNAVQGKTKAAEKLIQKIIPDIESFLKM